MDLNLLSDSPLSCPLDLLISALRLTSDPISPCPYRAQGNCDPEAPVTEGTRCCRRQAYLDLEKTKWADNWVVEPPGFLVYECAGSCLQLPERLANKWPFLGPRQCIASETTSLPVIVNVKEGSRTRLQVVSLPNMRVQECSCVSDGAPVSRGLQP
ncbi:hypothetical protein GHT09_019748 [Marmota monax]|uniref:TGF-beta family profile domain-containing protein n=1 Tax=Marmota monax TaxID=9995 RepID=A0A834PIR2_MARMO|nr:hypothetical protein GHT09_019748 [Marmota monax]